MYTLNQIVKIVSDYVDSSTLLKGFYFGELPNSQAGSTILYPCIQMVVLTSPVKENQDGFRFHMYFMDRDLDDRSNEVEVLSDMKLAANDLIAYFRQTQFDNNMSVDTEVEMNPFNQSFEDMCSGWDFPLNIKQYLELNICQIPTT